MYNLTFNTPLSELSGRKILFVRFFYRKALIKLTGLSVFRVSATDTTDTGVSVGKPLYCFLLWPETDTRDLKRESFVPAHPCYPLPLRGLTQLRASLGTPSALRARPSINRGTVGECFLVCSYAHHFLFSILSSLLSLISSLLTLHRPCLRTCLPSAA